MEKFQKKIIIISLIINFIILIFVFLIYVLFFFKNENEINFIKTNSIKIIKNSDIIKNSENPKWIFNNETNLDKNIFSWFFIDKNTIITVAHWVNDEQSKYEIIDINSWKSYDWELFFKDIENDFAKIKIKNDFKNFRKIKIWKDIKIWENIYSYSFWIKDNLAKKVSWKILEINWNKIKTDIVFEDWNSGWVIFNEKNEVLWIIIEIDIEKNVWYFLSINNLKY